MGLNSDKPHLWKADVERSIDFYNDWFLRFAPETYRQQRAIRTKEVVAALEKTANLTRITPEVLRQNPGVLPMLRMITAPPLARDRLMGLSYVGKNLIESMEGKDEKPPRLPSRMPAAELTESLTRICDVIAEVADRDLFPWLDESGKPDKAALDRAATVVADRLCGAAADPIIRNAQEKRQLATIGRWLKRQGYRQISTEEARDPRSMPAGTYTFRLSLPSGKSKATVSIPIDCVVKPLGSAVGEMPILVEAKSAGDATNTNKRRKEEAQKFTQLKARYGKDICFILLLCGYFEPGYLGYEASEGIDWVWEHRLGDLDALLTPTAKKKAFVVSGDGVGYDVSSHTIEKARYAWQRQIDESKTPVERNRLGQFSTPYRLARQMVVRALSHLSADTPISFLEPALGTGVFYSALRDCAGQGRLVDAEGVELDAAYGDAADNLWHSEGLRVHKADFTAFVQDSAHKARFNLLCTNPPYVRHHHLEPELKLALQARVKGRLGITVSGLSGLYVYFVLLAHEVLAEGAVASWLLPSEFLYVNYGKALRDYLQHEVTLLDIYQFQADEVQFDDALVSSCVVTYAKRPPVRGGSFQFSVGADIENPIRNEAVSLENEGLSGKWTLHHFVTPVRQDAPDAPRLGDLFNVRRGMATGANDFFIVDKATVERYAIPAVFLKPVLPSPRYVSESIIFADDQGNPRIERCEFLVDCDLPPGIVKDKYPGLWAYLQVGVAEGIPERYLCGSRDEWYYQEKRPPAPYLVTYMGRSNAETQSPFRFILNLSRAVVTNVYLNLYPGEVVAQRLREAEGRPFELLELLNGIPLLDVVRAGRAYGGGLHKIEPKELAQVVLPGAPDWLRPVPQKQLVLL